MADALYNTDILVWSEQQSDLLRRLAAGERVNERIDWPNLIEEVRDLGLSELRSCTSWIGLVCVHVLKLRLSPEDRDAGHWTAEVNVFLTQLQDHYTPSMARKIDVARQYERARRKVVERNRLLLNLVPEICPYTLDDFLSEDTTVGDLLAKLDPPA